MSNEERDLPRFVSFPEEDGYYEIVENADGTQFQWEWVEHSLTSDSGKVWRDTRREVLEDIAAHATMCGRDLTFLRARLARKVSGSAGETTVDVEAATFAYLAWRRVADAKTPLEFSQAMVEAQNAMSDLASWLPGYDARTGLIAAERI